MRKKEKERKKEKKERKKIEKKKKNLGGVTHATEGDVDGGGWGEG